MIADYLRAFYYLEKFNRSAYWDRKRIADFQNRRLRHVLKYAYENVKYYHDIFKEKGIYPGDVTGKDEINKLPILRKNMIRENPQAFLSKQFNPEKLRKLSTSGSTGAPLFVYLSPVEDVLRKSRHLRANTSCGQRLRDRWVVITSPNHFGATTRLQRMLRFYVPTPVSVFSRPEEQISEIEHLNPDVLDGYSSSLFILAKEVRKRKTRKINPRFVIGGAELVDDASKRVIEDVFEVPFLDHYACVEFDRISWQCPEKIGYHIDSDALILQFIDEEGNEVAKGEKGEIVCTSLFNYAMPFVRYAIGDVGKESDEECTCGRKLPLMKVIEGRRDSNLVFPNGRIVSPRAFTVAINMFPLYNLFEQFRVIQKKVDYFQIKLKLKAANVNEEALSKDLVDHITRALNVEDAGLTFDVRFVGEIPMDSTGKLTMVSSELSKEQ